MTQHRSHGPAPSRRGGARQHTRSALAVALVIFVSVASVISARLIAAQSSDSGTPAANSAPVSATPSATMAALPLDLKELNDSGIRGSVTLYDNGKQTIVSFDVKGAGGDHPARIYPGTCETFEPNAAYMLNPVNDQGKSTSGIATPITTLTASPHVIVLHMAPKNLGTVIACADVKGEPGPQSATPVAATPQASTATATTSATATPASTATAAATATPKATGTPAATPGADGTGGATADSTPVTVTLPELNDSGVKGKVVLTSVGQKTNVSVMVSPDSLGPDAALHMHDGTCDVPGDSTIELKPVDSKGVSTTLVDAPIASLTDGNHMVNIHPDEENWDAWSACADIPVTGSTAQSSNAGQGGTTTTPASGRTSSSSTSSSSSTGGQTSSSTSSGSVPSYDTADGTTGANSNAAYRSLPSESGVGTSIAWPTDWHGVVARFSLAAAGLCLIGGVISRVENRSSDPSTRSMRTGL